MGGTKSSPMPSTVQLPASIHLAGLDQRRQHRADRIGQHHLGLRRHLREEAAEPGQRAARADADHHRVDVAVELLPDLRPGRRLMRQRVGRIGELVDVERAGRLRGDASRPCPGNIPDGPCRRRSASCRTSAPSALQMLDLLARHLVGHDEHDAIALRDADLREAEPGIAGGRLDDRAARLELAAASRRRRSSTARCGP